MRLRAYSHACLLISERRFNFSDEFLCQNEMSSIDAQKIIKKGSAKHPLS